jgi:hypothetical protein
MTDFPPARSYLPPEIPVIQLSRLALYSLFAGVAAWALIPFFGALAAIFLGHKARLEIARSQGKLTGDGLAVTGLALGYANAVACACGVFCVAGLFLLPVIESLLSR